MTYLIVIILVGFSGLFSGLTLGLLSLSKGELERKIELGDKKAKKVYSVRKKGNLLLCTLLLGNVAVNSALAIFLGDIASGFMAGLVATGLIVIFGEIIPQASFAKYALEVGAKTAWIVKIFIVLLYPICAPIAWVLDKTLGAEMPTVYSKKELVKIIEEHEDSKESDIDRDEERIIRGALTYSEKQAGEIMTGRDKVYTINEDEVFDEKLIAKIKKRGHTRIPVFHKSESHIVGILYVKDLLGHVGQEKVGKLCHKHKLVHVKTSTKLDKLLNDFIKNKLHIALVEDKKGEFQGLVTLEDVIEEVLKIEIVDETD